MTRICEFCRKQVSDEMPYVVDTTGETFVCDGCKKIQGISCDNCKRPLNLHKGESLYGYSADDMLCKECYDEAKRYDEGNKLTTFDKTVITSIIVIFSLLLLKSIW